MKQFNHYLNQKLYFVSIFILIVLMAMGLLIDNPRFAQFDLGYIFHMVLVILLSGCIILYPRYETHTFRMIILFIGSGYFYTIFFLYPETSSGLILICFLPAISILFFDARLFSFSLTLNGIFMTVAYSYIMFADSGDEFSHIKLDLFGNIFNSIGSQVILYLVFYFSYARIKKMQSYYEELQQSERLKTTGQLAAAVAHEIRNPLTVVKGFLQLFEQEPTFPNEAKRKFSLMVDELNTAEQVISHFLTIAKPDKDRIMESIDVQMALQSVTDLIKSYGLLHDNRIECHVQDHCSIAINVIEFKQLIINLIKNAIEASENGGVISIAARRNQDYVEINIIDNGCGISEEEIKSLGTPFYSLKSKGTGLGLMICFNIVERNNGTIHFTSIIGQGTTVHLRFPFDNS
jgi:two-component system, sporulation sensor kinase B